MYNNTKMMRKFIVSIMILIVCTLTACSKDALTDSMNNGDNSGEKNSGNQIILGLSYIPNIQFAPFYIAKDKQYFDSNVELRHHGSEEGIFDALLTGNEHFVVAGADEAMKAMDSNNELDLVVISKYYNKYPVAIFTLYEKNINKPADLKGKTIGIPGRFGENYYALLMFLKENNLSEKDVNIKEIGYTQLVAMKTKEVDAVVGYTNNDLIQFEENNIKVNTLQITDNNPLIGASIITTRKYAKENLKEIEKIKEGIRAGIEFSIKSPEETVDITASKYATELKNETNKNIALKVLKATNNLFDPENKGKFENILHIDMCNQMEKAMLEAKILSKKQDKQLCLL